MGLSSTTEIILENNSARVSGGVLSPRGCRPRWAATMELSAEYLREKLQRDLEAEHVEVEDVTPNHCASRFQVLMVSAKLEGKPLLQRHRLVNTCLAEELLHIHAFEQKTLIPEQWAREQQKYGTRPAHPLHYESGTKKKKRRELSSCSSISAENRFLTASTDSEQRMLREVSDQEANYLNGSGSSAV